MKKTLSIIKVLFTEDMNIFKISTKKQNVFTKILLPIILSLTIMATIYSYSESIIEELEKVNMEISLLAIFILITSIITLVEGIYKSGNLLFNCKDDNLLFSLPIRKRTVVFIRIFKFYVFELLYNSLFLFPAIIAYAIHVNPQPTYYITSLIGLFIFPIIPIILSCVIGTFITYVSTRFKSKNLVQILVTFIFLFGILYISYNFNNLATNIAEKASSINSFIDKIYYPARAYIELINNFSMLKLLEFVLIHIALFFTTILVIGKVYFKINTKVKSVNVNKKNNYFKIKTMRPMEALIKKEFSRFINSTVFVTNAGFGLVLCMVGSILIAIKVDSIANMIQASIPEITLDYIKNCMPVILFAIVCFTSFMTSITSSMISLEGKSFTILKSLPLKPYTIVKAKVLTAVLIIVPCILLGDFIIFANFKFDLLSVILILVASVLFPLLSQTIGIIINLKYPRMDAKNDTEIVKQSMSSAISVFIGMALLGITIYLLFKALSVGITNNVIIMIFTAIFVIIYIVLIFILHKICDKCFNNICI